MSNYGQMRRSLLKIFSDPKWTIDEEFTSGELDDFLGILLYDQFPMYERMKLILP